MDKHTKRYMMERFGFGTKQEMSLYNFADAINNASGYDDFAYLSEAVSEFEDETTQKVLKEQILKRQLGWD